MHISFLPYLIDPQTGEDLVLEVSKGQDDFIIEGKLISNSNSYLITGGIPRFSKENYTGSFGFEWNRWPKLQFEEENVGRPMQGHTLSMWEKITDQKDLSNQVVAEFGCGSGRFLDIVRKKGGKAIGIDMSLAVEAAYGNFEKDPNVLIVQGDILNPPIKPSSLDGAYSIGVLHHTTSPKTGFEKIFQTVKKNGWVAISVYGKGGHYGDGLVNLYRRLFKRLSLVAGYRPAVAYSYFTVYAIGPLLKIPILRYFGYGLKLFFPFMNLPDKRWSLLDTFDSVTPSQQSGHDNFEVYGWFKELEFSQIKPSDWAGTSWNGIK